MKPHNQYPLILRRAATSIVAATIVLLFCPSRSSREARPSGAENGSLSTALISCLFPFGNGGFRTGGIITPATAQQIVPMPCTGHWEGPSVSNDFNCDDIEQTFISKPPVWSVIIPACLGAAILIFGASIILIGRYVFNIWGSSKMRPNSFFGGKTFGPDPDDARSDEEKAQQYTDHEILVVKVVCIVLPIIGCVALILNVVGGSIIAADCQKMKPAVAEAADWAMGLVDQVKSALLHPELSSVYPQGFNEALFDDIKDHIIEYKGDGYEYIDYAKDYIVIIVLVMAFVTFIPAGILFLPAVAAFLHIRRILPLVFICLAFFFQFLYFAASSAALALALGFTLLHEDFGSTKPDQRGITQWYFVPQCTNAVDFPAAKRNIADMEKIAGDTTCGYLLEVCSDTAAYDPSNSMKIFYCNLRSADECNTILDLFDVINSIHLKTGIPADVISCTGAGAEQCTIRECAKTCANSDVRSVAEQVVDGLDTVQRIVYVATDFIDRWFSCETLIAHAMHMNAVRLTGRMRASASVMVGGSILIAIALVGAIVVGLLGQKRFIDKYAMRMKMEGTQSMPAARKVGKAGTRPPSPVSVSPTASTSPAGYLTPTATLTPTGSSNATYSRQNSYVRNRSEV